MTTTEAHIERQLISVLEDLKYTLRPDIHDRATLEANFRERIHALNRVNLTDKEFQVILLINGVPVLQNELRKIAKKYFLSKGADTSGYVLRDTGNTPFFQHVANLVELEQAEKAGKLYTHHFNILRSILEKTASFHGYGSFGDCIRPTADDPDKTLHARVMNIMSHGNYSLYEPIEMLEENKALFRTILNDFRTHFPFNRDPFNEATEAEAE